MGFLKVIRAIVLILIVLGAIGFTARNPDQSVRIDLFFVPPFTGVSLTWALFCAFGLGFVGGLAVALIRVLELRAQLRKARRSGDRLQDELTTLRNLPLEESEEASRSPGALS
jgi:uncharacterized integral membrane protein